jgi:hypothetical protein
MGSARVWRAGDCVFAIANFPCEFSIPAAREINEKIVLARRQNQDARRARYPELCAVTNSLSQASSATRALFSHQPM